MLTSAASGYTSGGNVDVTRWREDATCDNWGSFIYLRDTRGGEVWSAGYQPAGIEPDSTRLLSPRGGAEFTRQDGRSGRRWKSPSRPNTTPTSAGLHHQSRNRTREIELTSYAERAMVPLPTINHPDFAKLFVEPDFGAAPGVRSRPAAEIGRNWKSGRRTSQPSKRQERHHQFEDRPGAVSRPAAIRFARRSR